MHKKEIRKQGHDGEPSMIIKLLETKDEIKGKAAVHYQAWKEAYVDLVNQDFSSGTHLTSAG